ncbi:hypothetical protein [Gottfriedia acidiceleris]|uniref:hypothetical protein n=1 Tax=Gottfriedia acidiceleris TaxID=371036 RepID=UPI002FFD9B73
MKNLICTLYILSGLILVTLTYFTTFEGPILLRGVGWILFLGGLFFQLILFNITNHNPLKDLFNTETNEKK